MRAPQCACDKMAYVLQSTFDEHVQWVTRQLTDAKSEVDLNKNTVEAKIKGMEDAKLDERTKKLDVQVENLNQRVVESEGNFKIAEVEFKKHENNFNDIKEQLQQDAENKKKEMQEMEGKVKQLQAGAEKALMELNDKLKTLEADTKKTTEDMVAQGVTARGSLANAEQAFLKVETQMKVEKEEIEALKGQLRGAFTEANQQIHNLDERINRLNDGGGSGSTERRKGYLPLKNLVPKKKFGGKLEEWRTWRDDTMDYVDFVTPGVKMLLKNITKECLKNPEVTAHAQVRKFNDANPLATQWKVEHSMDLWRLLKEQTEGEARRLLQTAPEEDGWESWMRLVSYYEPGLACQQAAALHEMTRMSSHPAKTVEETKKLVAEFNVRLQLAEELSGKLIDTEHQRSVLCGILDPRTREHTLQYQGVDADLDVLKRKIFAFINGATSPPTATTTAAASSGRGAQPMLIGALGGGDSSSGDDWWYNWSGNEEELAEDEQTEEDAGGPWQYVNALKGNFKGKGKSCYGCGSRDHLVRDCPAKGKGKGSYGKGTFGGKSGFGGKGGKGTYGGGKGPYGGGKGYGGFKGGGGKGPVGGCHNCGGPHYARDCPRPAGGAPGQARFLNQAAPRIPMLTMLKTVEVNNKFNALAEDDSVPAVPKVPEDMQEEYYIQRINRKVQRRLKQEEAKCKSKDDLNQDFRDPVDGSAPGLLPGTDETAVSKPVVYPAPDGLPQTEWPTLSKDSVQKIMCKTGRQGRWPRKNVAAVKEEESSHKGPENQAAPGVQSVPGTETMAGRECGNAQPHTWRHEHRFADTVSNPGGKGNVDERSGWKVKRSRNERRRVKEENAHMAPKKEERKEPPSLDASKEENKPSNCQDEDEKDQYVPNQNLEAVKEMGTKTRESGQNGPELRSREDREKFKEMLEGEFERNLRKTYGDKLSKVPEMDEVEIEKMRAQDKFLREKQTKKPGLLQQMAAHVKNATGGNIRFLRKIEPEGLNAVAGNGGWEEIEFNVDSGATETVIGEKMLMSVETKEGDQRRRGVEYEVANGVSIPNLGEKRFIGHTEEGCMRGVVAQVTEVNKALMSVFKIVAMGNKVVFGDDDGDYIEDKATGERVWMVQNGGMYTVKMWVNTAEEQTF